MTAFTVRPVPVADTRALRREVLRPHETVEQQVAGEAEGALAVGAFAPGGELVSVGLVAPGGEGAGGWRVRGMATAPAWRGRGAGSAVLAALVDHARAHGARRVWCNARTPALSLYARAGFVAVSDEFELPQLGPHRVMELRLDEAQRDAAAAAQWGTASPA